MRNRHIIFCTEEERQANRKGRQHGKKEDIREASFTRREEKKMEIARDKDSRRE